MIALVSRVCEQAEQQANRASDGHGPTRDVVVALAHSLKAHDGDHGGVTVAGPGRTAGASAGTGDGDDDDDAGELSACAGSSGGCAVRGGGSGEGRREEEAGEAAEVRARRDPAAAAECDADLCVGAGRRGSGPVHARGGRRGRHEEGQGTPGRVHQPRHADIGGRDGRRAHPGGGRVRASASASAGAALPARAARYVVLRPSFPTPFVP